MKAGVRRPRSTVIRSTEANDPIRHDFVLYIQLALFWTSPPTFHPHLSKFRALSFSSQHRSIPPPDGLLYLHGFAREILTYMLRGMSRDEQISSSRDPASAPPPLPSARILLSCHPPPRRPLLPFLSRVLSLIGFDPPPPGGVRVLRWDVAAPSGGPHPQPPPAAARPAADPAGGGQPLGRDRAALLEGAGRGRRRRFQCGGAGVSISVFFLSVVLARRNN